MFEGYLLKFGNSILPNSYLALNTYTVTPDKRNIIEDWEDLNGLSHRDAHKKYKTKLEFNTVDCLNLDRKVAMQQIFKSGLLNETERRYNVTYWNDETNSYEQMECRMNDLDYPIRWIPGNNVIYGQIRVTLTEC